LASRVAGTDGNSHMFNHPAELADREGSPNRIKWVCEEEAPGIVTPWAG